MDTEEMKNTARSKSSNLNGKAKNMLNTAAEKTGLSKLSQSEGGITKALESQTAKLPSSLFLSAGLIVVGAAALLELSGRKENAKFVGQWVAPLMLFGIYNKIVKTTGHDKNTNVH